MYFIDPEKKLFKTAERLKLLFHEDVIKSWRSICIEVLRSGIAMKKQKLEQVKIRS